MIKKVIKKSILHKLSPYTVWRVAGSKSYFHHVQTYAGNHNVDFINDIIPNEIKRVRFYNKTPFTLLDSGCGIGLFNDQVRNTFRNVVSVFGTNLDDRDSLQNLRSNIFSTMHKYIETNNVDGFDKPLAGVVSDFDVRVNVRDGFWRQIEDIPQSQRFNMIIDTRGEFPYSLRDSKEIFLTKLVRAINCLYRNGSIYIGSLDVESYEDAGLRYFWGMADYIGSTYDVAITFGGKTKESWFEQMGGISFDTLLNHVLKQEYIGHSEIIPLKNIVITKK